jgi:hypothetical protein
MTGSFEFIEHVEIPLLWITGLYIVSTGGAQGQQPDEINPKKSTRRKLPGSSGPGISVAD